jgi:hypothetical protein
MLLLRGGQPEGTTAVRIGLERATIGRLQILEPLPGTLDLSDLKVCRWDLPRGPSDEKYQYKEMLENSFPFRKSNYLAIEHALQNDGMNEQADEVHVLMRRRDRRNIHSCWMALLDRLLDLSTKYGTTSTRLVSVMLILFVISVWVFNDRNHVEYEIAPLGGKPPPVEHPAPASWSVGDAVLLALRLHVPIISLGVDEKVQPSGTRLKAYAVIVVAGSWVMWPLLIASVSGYLRKRN